jgi:dihydroceramidase
MSPSAATAMQSTPYTPYWGPVTSNHDWCEPNYQWSPYIAEFWNTVSSLTMVFLGLFGMWFSYKNNTHLKAQSYISAFFGLTMVGVGSVLFHSTLLFEAQMADELPMILGTLVYMYIVMDVQFLTWRKQMTSWWRTFIINGLILYGMMISYVMLSQVGTHVPFLFAYGFMVAYIVISSFMMAMTSTDEVVSKWFWYSVASYLIAFAFWLLERNFCSNFWFLQYMHAVWHLGAGYGTFSLLMWTAYLQASARKLLKHKMKTKLGVPYVDFHMV